MILVVAPCGCSGNGGAIPNCCLHVLLILDLIPPSIDEAHVKKGMGPDQG